MKDKKTASVKSGSEVAKMSEQMGAKIKNPSGADYGSGHKKIGVSKEAFKNSAINSGVMKKSSK